MSESHDLIVVGAGTAGLVTAAGATYLGARVALVERERLGGDCLWTGCVPSKALIASARAAQLRRDSGRLGILGKARPVELREVMESMRAARALAGRPDDPARFRAMGVEVVFGAARLVGHGRVQVGDRVLRGRRIVIATGARPAVPAIPGLAETGYLTHQDIFELTETPASLAIIGAGPVGVELAQTFQRLGVPVVLFEARPLPLPAEDPDAARVALAALRQEGVTVETGATILRIESVPAGRSVVWRRDGEAEQQVTVDRIVVAAGRTPNTDGLGLAALGLTSADGAVPVDRYLRTRVRGIWAAGDVTGGLQFTHVADYQAGLVVRNALTPFRAAVDYRAVPRVTYCDPEVVQVGPTEAEADAAGTLTKVWRFELADLDRAIVERRTEGFVKLLAGPGRRLQGATLAGLSAGELAPLLSLAIRSRMRVDQLADIVYPYPTMSEAVLRAARRARQSRLDSFAGRLLRKLVRFTR